MKRWALIKGNVVDLTTEQEDEPTVFGKWIDITDQHVGPGYSWDGEKFSPPVEEQQ